MGVRGSSGRPRHDASTHHPRATLSSVRAAIPAWSASPQGATRRSHTQHLVARRRVTPNKKRGPRCGAATPTTRWRTTPPAANSTNTTPANKPPKQPSNSGPGNSTTTTPGPASGSSPASAEQRATPTNPTDRGELPSQDHPARRRRRRTGAVRGAHRRTRQHHCGAFRARRPVAVREHAQAHAKSTRGRPDSRLQRDLCPQKRYPIVTTRALQRADLQVFQ